MKRIFFLISSLLFLFQGCENEITHEPSGEGKVLVLMYHRIVDGTPSNLYERSVDDLEADLRYLRDNKIKIISFDEFSEYAEGSRSPDGNVAILTFDDGDSSWFTIVMPLLIQYNACATFFLWTHMMGHDSFLTWDEIASMSHFYNSDGVHPFTFGSHTCSHAWLQQRKSEFVTPEEYTAFLDYELGESKRMIEEHTPGEVNVLSLPYGNGAGDQEIIAAARRNGYSFIRTSVWASSDLNELTPFSIPSFPVLDLTTQEEIGSYFE